MRWYFLLDLVFLVPICAVVAVVYCTARNHRPRPLAKDIALWFIMLVAGLVGASAAMMGLSLIV